MKIENGKVVLVDGSGEDILKFVAEFTPKVKRWTQTAKAAGMRTTEQELRALMAQLNKVKAAATKEKDNSKNTANAIGSAFASRRK